MLHYIKFYWFSSVIAAGLAHIDVANSFTFEIDQCKDICADSFFLLPSGKDSQLVCQRGCRFFNIIDFKERTINDTTKECHSSCAESYVNIKSRSSCFVGCDTMSKKKQSDMQNFFPYMEQYNTDEQEFDSLEADILLDPLIKKQLQSGYDLQYKIPEAYIRTMPIDDGDINFINENSTPYKHYKSKIICSSLIPSLIFILIIGGLIFCGVRIIGLVKAIRTDKIRLNPEDLNNALIKQAKEANDNCNLKYKMYEIPGIAFMINFPGKKKLSDITVTEDFIVVRS